MHIVEGSGKSRRVIALPHGSLFHRAAKSDNKAERKECKQAVGAVFEMVEKARPVSLSEGQLRRIAARTLRLARRAS